MMATSRSWTAAPTARTNASLARSLLVFSFIFFAARRKLLSRISSAVGTVGIFSNSTNLQPIYILESYTVYRYGLVAYPEGYPHYPHHSLPQALAVHQRRRYCRHDPAEPGTVRNQMQALKTIGLVDGVPGPKGGYIPTALALSLIHISEPTRRTPISYAVFCL